ncbi:purine-nucleoside phosphorylase [Paenalkalicoccus suaedae]|uniref:Purine nucleoside phosphorylase n=1 Tax=Paenalkalicoccus suaedae TaxID=2592382 RepID=A0A859FFL6_9BACI|nr:purine-nucleoside phosphorylase [Paenalkalicoccus suaedae]QKS71026.1 purine-nucleoside phosphorylase [Paenalkalicoccus suaedae]
MTNRHEAAQFIRDKSELSPTVGLILGSGLGELADEITNATYIDYTDIPHFPTSTVAGHKGQLVIGELEGVTVIAMQGRFHYYEGYSMQEVTFPVRVMKELGCESVIVTNACGSMNKNFQPGELMLITDHINFTGANPLIGPNDAELGARFPDMTTAYTRSLQNDTKKLATQNDITLHEGVYLAVSGPTYMAGAELTMLRTFGADVVGMSTVPETIVARHMGMKVLGISCITDMAIGEEMEGITHEEVMEVAAKAKPAFKKLIKLVLKKADALLA